MKTLATALFLLLIAMIPAWAQPAGNNVGKLWLPEGMQIYQAGDTLNAERDDSTGLTVRVYPVKVKASSLNLIYKLSFALEVCRQQCIYSRITSTSRIVRKRAEHRNLQLLL